MEEQIQFPKDSETIEVHSVSFTFANINEVISDFYQKVAVDPMLKVPFHTVTDWPHHVERLTHFWWIRFGGDPYMQVSYNPPEKHFQAGFNKEFLTKWLALFQETLDSRLNENQAKLWGNIAERMGESLSIRNDLIKQVVESSRRK